MQFVVEVEVQLFQQIEVGAAAEMWTEFNKARLEENWLQQPVAEQPVSYAWRMNVILL
jgi:hypothetical protein